MALKYNLNDLTLVFPQNFGFFCWLRRNLATLREMESTDFRDSLILIENIPIQYIKKKINVVVEEGATFKLTAMLFILEKSSYPLFKI